MFSTLYGIYFSFQMHFKMSSAICFNLDRSRTWSSGNRLALYQATKPGLNWKHIQPRGGQNSKILPLIEWKTLLEKEKMLVRLWRFHRSTIMAISHYLSFLPVAHPSDTHKRRLVVTGDSARIQDETNESSAWFYNVLGTLHHYMGLMPHPKDYK